MALILDGTIVAKEIKDEIRKITANLSRAPKLAILTVGSDYAADAYLATKQKACASLGIDCQVVSFDKSATTEELTEAVKGLNSDETVDGIMLQTPTAQQIDNRKVFDEIAPDKDVDGTSSASFGALCMNTYGYKPATALAVIKILDYYGINVEGKSAVVVGRSAILGKPAAMLLLNKNATVTVCHSKTRDLPSVISRADVLLAAIGKAEYIKADWIKSGAVIIDAGFNAGNVGDVELSVAKEKASAYTPVPKGVGPVTNAVLLLQVAQSAQKRQNANK